MEMDKKGESGSAVICLGKLERSKVSIITVGDCACDGTGDEYRRGLQRVVLLGSEDARFVLAAAEDPSMGVSGTKTAENVAAEVVRGRGFDRIWSNNVSEQLQCLSEALRNRRIETGSGPTKSKLMSAEGKMGGHLKQLFL